MTHHALPTSTGHGASISRRRRCGALLGLVAGLSLMATVGAPSAFAHTELESSNPADGGTVEQPPTGIQLVFADTVRGADPVFTITVAGSEPVEAPAVIDGATVTADLTGVALPAATYPAAWEVGYRLVALDGDAFRGDITFTVAAGPAPATSASPETTAPVTTAAETTAPASTAPTTEVTVTGTGTTTSSNPSSAAAATSDAESGAAPTTGAPVTAATADSDSGSGAGWWWFGGVVVVVLVAGGGYWYARSRRPTPPAA